MLSVLFAAFALSGCSCVIFHEEFELGRAMKEVESSRVAQAIADSSFTKHDRVVAGLVTKVAVIEPDHGSVIFRDSLCPFISAAFYYPGPDKWYEANRREVVDVMSRASERGMTFKKKGISLPLHRE